ncbi:MAG: hypothetical protein AB3N16_15105 [Flavobacteriaceae bacterium]
MIVFRAKDLEIDLSSYGLSLNEENNMFIDSLIKSYSFPFTMDITREISEWLGFPNILGIQSFDSNILGTLVIDDKYFSAELVLGKIKGERVEAEIYYGDELLPVYDSKLSDLPWPNILETSSQSVFTKYLDKSWPEVSHNFPKFFRPDIKKENDYEDFQLFVNNTGASDFVQNVEETVEDEPVYRNRNVLTPCPYLMEILTFGFKSAGKKIRGTVVEEDALKNLVYLPETYIEKFKGSLYSAWEFDYPDASRSYVIDHLGGANAGIFLETVTVGIYTKTFTPDNIGTYNLKFRLNIDPVTAGAFSLNIYQIDPNSNDRTYIYSSKSYRNRVTIDEDLNIDITATNRYHLIKVEMEVNYTTDSIASTNSFEYSFKSGRLNELIGSYSLAQFMPDMKFGEYVNMLKNWLNLDISFKDEYVYIDFLEDVVEQLPTVDHSHLEVVRPTWYANDRRTFKLTYSDKSTVLVDKSGRIFSDLDKNEKDIVTIDMDVQMAKVESNHNQVTAVYKKNSNVFSLYPGLRYGKNHCAPSIDGFTGHAGNVYERYWATWLAIRTNNMTFADTFKAHQSEVVELRKKIFKYNHVLLPLSIKLRRKHSEYWQVTVEAETF